LAPPKQPGAGQIHRADFGEGAAEIDENSESRQNNSKGKSKKAELDNRIGFCLFTFYFCLHLAEAIIR
jgi:hypothetical protein